MLVTKSSFCIYIYTSHVFQLNVYFLLIGLSSIDLVELLTVIDEYIT